MGGKHAAPSAPLEVRIHETHIREAQVYSVEIWHKDELVFHDSLMGVFFMPSRLRRRIRRSTRTARRLIRLGI